MKAHPETNTGDTTLTITLLFINPYSIVQFKKIMKRKKF